MQIRVFMMLIGLAVFAGGVAGAYVVVFRGEQNPSVASGSGKVRLGQVERPIQGATELSGRATVEAGDTGALVDFGRGVRVTLKPGARIEVVSKGEHVVSAEWKAGDLDVAHEGQAGVSLAMAVELPGHVGARFLMTEGQVSFRAGGKGKAPSVAVTDGDVLREHRGDIVRARKGESLAVKTNRLALKEMKEELVRTVGTSAVVATEQPDSEAAPSGSGVAPKPAGADAPAARVEPARAEATADARRADVASRVQERPAARLQRARAATRTVAPRATAAARDARPAATAARAEPAARRAERATAAPDNPDDLPRTRIKRATTWR